MYTPVIPGSSRRRTRGPWPSAEFVYAWQVDGF